MANVKLTEKAVSTERSEDMKLLIVQTEDVSGTEMSVVRRIDPSDAGMEQVTSKVASVFDAPEGAYPSAAAVIDALEIYDRSKFGVSGVGGSSPTLTRIWDSVGKTALPGTDAAHGYSDFDEIAPFNRKKCVGTWSMEDGKAKFTVNAYEGDADYAEDGTMGDYVAIDVTPFYYMDDRINGIIGVSEYLHNGFQIHPICKNADGTVREHTYIPAYELAVDDNGHAVSLPGFHPVFGDYKTVWNYARTYGTGDLANLCILEPSVVNHYEWLLMTVEFATQNMQSVMAGATSMPYAADKISLAGTSVNSVVVTSTIGNKFTVGQTIYLGTTHSTTPSGTDAYNVITAIENCDSDGTLNPSGTYRLVTFDGPARTVTTSTVIASRPWKTGSTNSVLGHTGSPVSNTDQIHPLKYRWRENVYGNINKTCIDLMDVRVAVGSSYKLQWYYNDKYRHEGSEQTNNPSAVADLSTEAGWNLLGVETDTANYKDGYIKTETIDDDFPCVPIPTGIGGSATTYYCDYAYLVHSSLVRAVRRGGILSNGANYGPRYVAAHYAPSYSIWSYGGGLYFAQ